MNTQLLRTLTLLGLTCILASCGGGGDGGDVPKEDYGLVGTWQTSTCGEEFFHSVYGPGYRASVGPSSEKISGSEIVRFTADGLFTKTYTLYDKDCTQELDQAILSGSYTVGGAVLDTSGVTAHEIDVVWEGVDIVHGNYFVPKPAELPAEYFDIFYVQDGWLYLGDETAGDGDSKATRPTKLDFEEKYPRLQ